MPGYQVNVGRPEVYVRSTLLLPSENAVVQAVCSGMSLQYSSHCEVVAGASYVDCRSECFVTCVT
jgi:hypothetical protein